MCYEWFLSHPLSGRLTHRTSTWLTTPCGVCFMRESIVPKSRSSMKRRIFSEWAALSHTVIDSVVKERHQRLYALAFMLGADILSTRWNKDCVMRHVRQWLFWETLTVNHVCCNLVNHSNGDKCTLNYCVNGSVWHFKFPKVVQAHTLGEVGILGTIFLKVSSGTILTIFYWNRFIFDRQRAKK